MKKMRMGVIGMGVEGRLYAEDIDKGRVPNMELTAVYNRSLPGREWSREHLSVNVRIYDDVDEMLDNGPIDGVVITLPHYLHPDFAEKALKKNKHVLIEKPAGVYTKQVRHMNAVADECDRVFAMMYNVRPDPIYSKVREFMESGALGDMKRVVWIVTDWYRNQAYYDSGSWRATWKGEGGGVLMNQATHNLDVLQWICGMPCSVRAFCKYGNHRNIEVENDVTAYLEFPGGATGLFVTATHEFPGTNRLEISGDNGKLLAENGRLLFYRSSVPEPKFNREAVTDSAPTYEVEDLTPEKAEIPGYIEILKNFADAVLDGIPLIADGREGINEVELANAMMLSDWIGEAVDPTAIDDALFKKLLDEKIANSVNK